MDSSEEIYLHRVAGLLHAYLIAFLRKWRRRQHKDTFSNRMARATILRGDDRAQQGWRKVWKFWGSYIYSPDHGLFLGLDFHFSIQVPLWFSSSWFIDKVLTSIQVPLWFISSWFIDHVWPLFKYPFGLLVHGFIDKFLVNLIHLEAKSATSKANEFLGTEDNDLNLSSKF